MHNKVWGFQRYLVFLRQNEIKDVIQLNERAGLRKTRLGNVAILRLGVVGKLLAFLWGSGELPRAKAQRDLAYLLLPRESRSFPTTPFQNRTPSYREIVFHNLCFISGKHNITSFYLQGEGHGWFFLLLIVEVLRHLYGKGAEGNGETPVGFAGQLRLHRTKSEEAQRPPHGKRTFSRSP